LLPYSTTAMMPADSPLSSARQLLLVTAPTWGSTSAQLRRFQRKDPGADWTPIGDTVPVSLGRSGLAWGIGLHGEIGVHGAGEPAKCEGDGCSPAGIFAITELFGDADMEGRLARSAGLPYRIASGDLKCIDDPASIHYNRIVDQRVLRGIDWQSHEDMLRSDPCYAIGAFVAHNSERPQPGAGSCIFLHVWKAAGVPTAGCTAGSLADMCEICLWLDGGSSPLLVQLPQADYARLKDRWALPSLAA
jgi:L,D-peptidoglycan transpeptidase YkuD (ErfK/YbiS/YcfS/YnhG family)